MPLTFTVTLKSSSQITKKISATIANGMVNGTADFSEIQQQAQRKTALYTDVLEKFKAAQVKADDRFF